MDLDEDSGSSGDGEKKSFECISSVEVKGRVQTMALSADFTRIVFGTMNGNVRVHRFNTETSEISPKKKSIWKLANQAATTDDDWEDETFDLDKCEEIERVTWFSDQQFILASTSRGYLCVCKEGVKSALTKIQLHGASIPWILPCFESRALVSCSIDGFLKLWKVDTSNKETPLKMLKKKKFGTGALHSLAVNPDDEMSIAVGGERGGVQVWNIAKAQDVVEVLGLKPVENQCPEQSVDFDHGVGEEEFTDFLANAEADTLGTDKKPQQHRKREAGNQSNESKKGKKHKKNSS